MSIFSGFSRGKIFTLMALFLMASSSPLNAKGRQFDTVKSFREFLIHATEQDDASFTQEQLGKNVKASSSMFASDGEYSGTTILIFATQRKLWNIVSVLLKHEPGLNINAAPYTGDSRGALPLTTS